jgi:DNA-directed RNA polymerase specialized sigma24 family protein
LEEITHLYGSVSDPYELCSRNLLSEQTYQAWESIREEYKEVLRLLMEGYKAGKIAQMRNCSTAEIYALIRYAREAFARGYKRPVSRSTGKRKARIAMGEK